MLIALKIYNLDSSLSFEFKFDHHRLISIAKERNQGQVKDYLIQCPFGKYIRERERGGGGKHYRKTNTRLAERQPNRAR